MEVIGKIIDVLPAQSGKSARGDWKKQEFVIETQDQFPKKICMTNWNNKVNLDTYPKGALIKVFIEIESREYNGKWYTEVKVWKAESMDSQKNTSASSIDDMPVPPMPEFNENSGEADLPF